MQRDRNARRDAFVEKFDRLDQQDRACRLRASRVLTVGDTPVLVLPYATVVARIVSDTLASRQALLASRDPFT
jgi:hypothetical protein